MTEIKIAPNGQTVAAKPELKVAAVRIARAIEPDRKTKPPVKDANHPYYKEGLFGPKSQEDIDAAFIYINRTNAQAEYYRARSSSDKAADITRANALSHEAADVEDLFLMKYDAVRTDLETILNSITDPDYDIQLQKRVDAKMEYFKSHAEALEQRAQNQSTRLAQEMEFFTESEANAAILFLESVPLTPQDVGYDDPLKYEQACVLAAKDFAQLPLDDQGLTDDARRAKVRTLAEQIYANANINHMTPFEMRGKQNVNAQIASNNARIDAVYLAVASELSANPTKYAEAVQEQKFDVSEAEIDQEIQRVAASAGVTQASNSYEYQNIVNKVYASHLRGKAESLLTIPQAYLDANGDPEAYRLKYHEMTSQATAPVPAEAIIEAVHQDAVAKDQELIQKGIEKAYNDVYIAQAIPLLDQAKLIEALDNGKFDVSGAFLQQEVSDKLNADGIDPADAVKVAKVKQGVYARHLRAKTESSLHVPQDVDQNAYILKWKDLYTRNKGTIPSEAEVRAALGIDQKVADALNKTQDHVKLTFEGKYASQLLDNEEVKRYVEASVKLMDEMAAMHNDPAYSENDDVLREKLAPLQLMKQLLEAEQQKRTLTPQEQAQLDHATKELSLGNEFLAKDDKVKREERAQLQTQLRQKDSIFQSYINHIGTLRGMTPEFAQKMRTAMEDKWYRGNSENWDELMRQKETQNWLWLLGMLGAVIMNASGTIMLQGIGQAASVGRQ